MSNESSKVWKILKKYLEIFGHLQRHEDAFAKGIPDVSFGYSNATIWIELKFLSKWPIRENTKIKIQHYTPEQKLWLRLRGRTAGRCWLFIRIADDFLLFDHIIAQEIGELNKQEMLNKAAFYSPLKNLKENIPKLLNVLSKMD